MYKVKYIGGKLDGTISENDALLALYSLSTEGEEHYKCIQHIQENDDIISVLEYHSQVPETNNSEEYLRALVLYDYIV